MADDTNYIDTAIKALLKFRDACSAQGIQIVDIKGVDRSSRQFEHAGSGISLLVQVEIPVDVKHERAETHPK